MSDATQRPAPDAELIALGHKHAAAQAAYTAHGEAALACPEAEQARAIEAKGEPAALVMYRLEDRIFATRATTPEGWRIKARIAAHVLGPEPDGTYEDHLVRSLLADLLAG